MNALPPEALKLNNHYKSKSMSSIKFKWARQQKTGSGSANAVLKSLVWFANDELLAYPSINTLSEDTELNRKTVIVAIDRLLELKLLKDTGHRVGATKSIVVYRLNIDESLSSTDFGITLDEAVPILTVSSTDFDSKQSQNWGTEGIYDNRYNNINIPPIVPPCREDDTKPADQLDIAKLDKPMKLQKAWMQDPRIKQAFRDILADYGIEPSEVVWKFIAGSFVDYWTSFDDRTKKAKKTDWVATFRNWTRREANTNQFRWKKVNAPSAKPKLSLPADIDPYSQTPKFVRWCKEQGFRDPSRGEETRSYVFAIMQLIKQRNEEVIA